MLLYKNGIYLRIGWDTPCTAPVQQGGTFVTTIARTSQVLIVFPN